MYPQSIAYTKTNQKIRPTAKSKQKKEKKEKKGIGNMTIFLHFPQIPASPSG